MEFDPISTEGADINLDNYYLDHQYYNTYVYVHKKFKPKSEKDEKTHDAQTYVDNIQDAEHKSQQCNIEVNGTLNEKKKIRTSLHDDSMIEQTVKFAKDLIPKVIPPSREYSPTPVYYTIKTKKKPGKILGKLSSSCTGYDIDKKDKAKTFAKHTRIQRKEEANNSEKDDVSHSSQNSTLDEIQTNQSSTFSLSEGLESNQNKIGNTQRKRKHNVKENLVITETLDAIGTNLPAQAELKINIMNETEKNKFCESMKTPIIDSVKEYLNKIQNSTDISSYLHHLSQALTFNSQKLDFLVQKIDKIERYVVDYSDKTTKVIMSPKQIISKASKLEELAEDLDEIKEVSSIEEDGYQVNNSRNVMTSQSAVVTTNRRTENLSHGDNVPIHLNATSTEFGMKSERPNRIPARFCWTDTTENS